MSEGYNEWKMQVNEVVGSYFCLGILKNQDYDVKVDQWANSLCVCSDKNCYGGMVKIKGDISLLANDVIVFQLDLGENKFTIIGPNEKFVCEMRGIQHVGYIPFASYPAYAQSKISFA